MDQSLVDRRTGAKILEKAGIELKECEQVTR